MLSGWRRWRAKRRERARVAYARAVADMMSSTREILDGTVGSMARAGALRIEESEAPGMPGGTEIALRPSRSEAAPVWVYPESNGVTLLVGSGELWIPVEDEWEAYFARLIRIVIDGHYREDYVVTHKESGAFEQVTMNFEPPGEPVLVFEDSGGFPVKSVEEGSGERCFAAYR